MIKSRIPIFIATFLIIGFFFLALPEKGYSGTLATSMPFQSGCCQPFQEGPCFEIDNPNQICIGNFDTGQICNEDTGQCEVESTDVPTLSEWGLIAMAGILGIVGFMVIRRRKVTA